jgi:hypothetical protein
MLQNLLLRSLEQVHLFPYPVFLFGFLVHFQSFSDFMFLSFQSLYSFLSLVESFFHLNELYSTLPRLAMSIFHKYKFHQTWQRRVRWRSRFPTSHLHNLLPGIRTVISYGTYPSSSSTSTINSGRGRQGSLVTFERRGCLQLISRSTQIWNLCRLTCGVWMDILTCPPAPRCSTASSQELCEGLRLITKMPGHHLGRSTYMNKNLFHRMHQYVLSWYINLILQILPHSSIELSSQVCFSWFHQRDRVHTISQYHRR